MVANDIIKSIDCKYCVALNSEKEKRPFYCKLKKCNVSKKSCNKCDKRVFFEQISIDNQNDW